MQGAALGSRLQVCIGNILQELLWFLLRWKTYVPNTIIITSVGIDQNSGGTFVSGLHSYQGQYIPFRGRKTHTNVQFNAVIVRQPKRDYVVFNKWYEPDMLNRKGGWETGQRLITYK